MNKVIIIIVAIALVGGGIYFFSQSASYSASGTNTSGTPSGTPIVNPDIGNINPGATSAGAGSGSGTGSGVSGSSSHPGVYTLADVSAHGDRTSCWSAINGNVYDLTSWIAEHPGGPQRILSICGSNGSSAFNAQHGGDPRVASILAGFKIGTLSQ